MGTLPVVGADGAQYNVSHPGLASGVTPVTGTFTAAGQSAAFAANPGRDINITLSGTFGATLRLERKFTGDATWYPVTYIDGSALTWNAPMSTSLSEGEASVSYRLNCTSWNSGTVSYRISQ